MIRVLHTESSPNLGGQELRVLLEMEGLIPTFGDLIAISHDMPARGVEGSTAWESADIPWSQLARVMAIRPRGEQVEIACVVEHPLVHTADQ